MRTLQAFFIIAAVAAGALLAVRRAPAPGRIETSARDPRPVSPQAVSPQPEPTQPGSPQPIASRSPTLVPEHLRTLREEIGLWQFEAEEAAEILTGITDLDTDAQNVLGEWRVRRTLVRYLKGLEPPIPDSVLIFELLTGGTLVVREAETTVKGERLELLSGIRVTIAEKDLAGRHRLDRESFLRETKDEFLVEIEALQRDSLSELLRGIARCLNRDERELAEELYLRWIELGGAERLARTLPREEAETLDAGLTALGPRKAPPPSSAKHDRPLAVSPPRIAPPDSLEKLEDEMRKVRRKIGRRLPAGQRETILEKLAQWEVWLDHQEAETPERRRRVNGVRRDLQFLRLDLIKLSGF